MSRGDLSCEQLRNSVRLCPLVSPRRFSFSTTRIQKRIDNECFSTLTLEFASLPIWVAVLGPTSRVCQLGLLKETIIP